MTVDAATGTRPRRVVLVLPTETYRAEDFLAAAAAVGAEVVVATEHSPPMATEMEGRLVVVDFDRPEQSAASIASLADRTPVDAVIGVDDQGVLTAAHASEMLGLPHNPPDAVVATRDKAQARGVLASWGVRQPEYRVVAPDADVAAAAAAVGCPCVVKPLSLSAGTGVIRADSPDDAVRVAVRIRTILADHGQPADEPLLVERFVAGAEVSVEAILRDGDLQVLALFDKPDPLDGPYFEETIYVTPSRLSAAAQEAVVSTAAAACRALGLSDGPVHVELRIAPGPDGEPLAWVLEVAARSIGGLCSRVLRFGAGVSLEQLIVEHALGHDTTALVGSAGAAGVMMLPIPRSGVLAGVHGVEAARRVDGVVGVEITATVGHRIEALPEGGRYLGFVFARADTPEAAEAALRRAHAELTIDIVDAIAAADPGDASDPRGGSEADERSDRGVSRTPVVVTGTGAGPTIAEAAT